MAINPKSLLNLRPNQFNSETGREAALQQKKDPIRQGLNRLQHGKHSKNKEIIELITPTPTEKAVGIKKSDKIMALKRLNPLFGANSSTEFLSGVEEIIGEVYTELELLSQKKVTTYRQKMKLIQLCHQHNDRRFGSSQSSINIINQNNLGDGKMTMLEVHEKVIKQLQITQNEKEESPSLG